MAMKDNIAPYVKEGLTAREIHKLHPEWKYRTIYSAMHPEMCKRKKVKAPVEKVERPKGWNKDRKGCRRCQYRNAGHTPNGCNFILIEGHGRGCKVEDCNVYVKGKVIKLNANGALNKEHDVAAGFEV